jgi:hypothetical protein
MTKKRGSLGRGLSAILGNTSIGTTAYQNGLVSVVCN